MLGVENRPPQLEWVGCGVFTSRSSQELGAFYWPRHCSSVLIVIGESKRNCRVGAIVGCGPETLNAQEEL